MTDAQIIETIATKVMGWTIYPQDERPKGGDHTFRLTTGEILRQQNGSVYRFDPLTNAEHARQVREKLAEMGWRWMLHHDGRKFFFGLEKFPYQGPRNYPRVHADTEGRATCLAALKAVEGK